MGSSPRGVLALESVALLLAVGCSGTSSHSLRYFYTALSEPGQGLPQFIIVGYVDDQPFVKYDSHARRMLPQVPWMEEFGKEDPQYWEGQSQRAQGAESLFRVNLGTLRERFNQQNSTGLHTLQWMYGCEVGLDGQPRGGHYQFAYDGEDFLAFDKKTVSWVAAVPQAEISKQELDRRQYISQGRKDYLEGTCVEWLRRYLGYGKEALLRTEAPMTRVSRKKGYDGRETLFCQLYGFYPKEIEVTWTKDGEDQKPHTWTGGDVPNSDGTYHTWLSIEVDPKERNRYRCRVGHDSLPEPLDLAWEEPASHWGLLLGSVDLILSAVVILGVVIAFRRKQRKSYAAASRKREEKGHGAASRNTAPDVSLCECGRIPVGAPKSTLKNDRCVDTTFPLSASAHSLSSELQPLVLTPFPKWRPLSPASVGNGEVENLPGFRLSSYGYQRPDRGFSALLVNPTPHLSLLSSEDASQITVSSEGCSSQSSSDSSDGYSDPESEITN